MSKKALGSAAISTAQDLFEQIMKTGDVEKIARAKVALKKAEDAGHISDASVFTRKKLVSDAEIGPQKIVVDNTPYNNSTVQGTPFVDKKMEPIAVPEQGAFGKAMDAVDKYTGASAVRGGVLGALEGKPIADSMKAGFNGTMKAEGKDIAKNILTKIRDTGALPEAVTGETAETVLGMGADMLLDPTNLIGGGLAKGGAKLAGKGAKALKLIK